MLETDGASFGFVQVYCRALTIEDRCTMQVNAATTTSRLILKILPTSCSRNTSTISSKYKAGLTADACYGRLYYNTATLLS